MTSICKSKFLLSMGSTVLHGTTEVINFSLLSSSKPSQNWGLYWSSLLDGSWLGHFALWCTVWTIEIVAYTAQVTIKALTGVAQSLFSHSGVRVGCKFDLIALKLILQSDSIGGLVWNLISRVRTWRAWRLTFQSANNGDYQWHMTAELLPCRVSAKIEKMDLN